MGYVFAVFAVAGFWQVAARGKSFAMVTCDPNELVAPIHPKAMVAILEEADWDRWMNCPFEEVPALQRPSGRSDDGARAGIPDAASG